MNVLIRDLDDETVEALKRRAAESKRSLQAELKAIVEESVAQDWRKTWAAADRIFEELRRSGQKFPNLQNYCVRIASVDAVGRRRFDIILQS